MGLKTIEELHQVISYEQYYFGIFKITRACTKRMPYTNVETLPLWTNETRDFHLVLKPVVTGGHG